MSQRNSAPDATGAAPTQEWVTRATSSDGPDVIGAPASPPLAGGRETPPPMTDERLAEPLTPAQLAVLEDFASEMREHVIPEIVATIDRRRLAAAERRGQPLNAHPNDGTWRELHNAWRKRAEEAEAEVDRLRPLASLGEALVAAAREMEALDVLTVDRGLEEFRVYFQPYAGPLDTDESDRTRALRDALRDAMEGR